MNPTNKTRENIAQTVERLTKLSGAPTALEHRGVPLVVLPPGHEASDLEEFLPAPLRIEATPKFTDFKSFLAYVNRFKLPATTAFYTRGSGAFSVVFDYHAAGDPPAPAWGSHSANYSPTMTPEWEAWLQKNNKPFTQEEFAQFIEDNLREIVDPPGADMLQIASTFQATNNVAFSQATRLTDGRVQFSYVEEGNASAKGNLQIPETFSLALAPFWGGPTYKISARLRWRIANQKLSMWYRLDRPHLVLDDAIKELALGFEEATGILPLAGTK